MTDTPRPGKPPRPLSGRRGSALTGVPPARSAPPGNGRRPGGGGPAVPVSYLTFREAQAAVWANKVRQGFNTTDVAEELCLLMAEVGELADAWRKHRAPAPGRIRRALARARLWPLSPPVTDARAARLEVADVILFALSIAQMLKFDAGDAVADKLRINETRTYRRMPGGGHVRDRGVRDDRA